MTIRVLENFLRPYVERYPASWSQQLSIAEFAANNSVNASTGYTPFFLNTGADPTVPQAFLLPSHPQSENQVVQETLQRLHEATHLAKQHLEAAQQRMKHQADKSRREEEYS